MVEDHTKQKVHFTVGCHGVIPRSTDVHTTYVSSHWVRSCLEVHLIDLFVILVYGSTIGLGFCFSSWT